MSELRELLKQFVSQAHAGEDFSTKAYPKTFLGLRCKVSFGQGGRGDVAWICLLKYGQDVQQGYFTSYYYDWRTAQLSLVFGISETKPPVTNWPADVLTHYPEFISIPDASKFSKRYPHSRQFARYSIDTSDIASSLERQIATIERDLSIVLQHYTYLFDGVTLAVPQDDEPLSRILTPYLLRFKEKYSKYDEDTGREVESETGRVNLTGSEIREWMKTRIQSAFSKERIDTLGKDEVVDILSNLYAVVNGWNGEPDAHGHYATADEIVHQGFVQKVRSLLYGEGSFFDHYADLLKIKGLSHGTASEFLCYFDPNQYGILNTTSARALNLFGLDSISIPKSGARAGEYISAYFEQLKKLLRIAKNSQFSRSS